MIAVAESNSDLVLLFSSMSEDVMYIEVYRLIPPATNLHFFVDHALVHDARSGKMHALQGALVDKTLQTHTQVDFSLI